MKFCQEAPVPIVNILRQVDVAVTIDKEGAIVLGQDGLIYRTYSQSVENLINTLQPDIFVRGGDYTLDFLPEAKVVLKYGGKIELLPYTHGKFTTNTIFRIKTEAQ